MNLAMVIHTIGYGGRSPGEFLERLSSNGIRSVVDVRLRPDRASMGSYVLARTPDKGIERLLSEAGIGYQSLIELGNVFLNRENWPALYHEFLDRAGALLVTRLEAIPQPYCLMCAEKSPSECHRTIIAEYMARTYGVDVHHIM
jgi:uncharacterized protein (DUF488 family)